MGRLLEVVSAEGWGSRECENFHIFKIIVLKPQTTKSVSLNKVAAAHASGNRVQ